MITEFSNPKLVALYDTLNPFAADTKFYLDLAQSLDAKTIIDLGCGTGLLTCELAAKGYHVTGIEPEAAMLEVAKQRTGAGTVEWIQGDAENIHTTNADLVIMTGHVAQVFVDDTDWQRALNASYAALQNEGRIVFESRNPATEPWNSWTPQQSRKTIHHDTLGDVDVWSAVMAVDGNHVRYEMHYEFHDTGEDLVSENTLIFRTKDELQESVTRAGFVIEQIYGDWNMQPFDDTSREIIFVAVKK